MKTTNTPETDGKSSPHIGFFSCATVPAEFARKLEQERDEARTERDILKIVDPEWTVFIQQLERERDEAREAFVIATDQMVIAQGNVREANKERDEWAAMCGQYKQERDDVKADAEDLKLRYRNAMMDRDSYRFQAEQKYAMRRELEELLGIDNGAPGDEQFKKGFNNLKAIIAKLKMYEEGEK